MSTSILGVDSIHIVCKIPNDKVLVHLGFRSNVLHGFLTNLSAWEGFYTRNPQKGIKCQLRYWGVDSISCEISKGKVLPHLCLNEMYISPAYK